MRSSVSCLAGLLISHLVLAAATARQTPPAVFSFSSQGQAVAESLVTLSQHPLPPLRDMALDRFGNLLLLSSEGELRVFAGDDSLGLAPFSADLSQGAWPEAVAADGADWLLLTSQGRALLRLGRRGEALGQTQIPQQETVWRDLAVDRSGRIWLAELSGGHFACLSRGGQALQAWSLEERLAGFTGPVQSWCPDEQGGLWVAEGPPLILHHLNGAGNLLQSWKPGLVEGESALAMDPDGRLLVGLGPEGSEPHLFLHRLEREIYLASGGRLWIMQRPATGP